MCKNCVLTCIVSNQFYYFSETSTISFESKRSLHCGDFYRWLKHAVVLAAHMQTKNSRLPQSPTHTYIPVHRTVAKSVASDASIIYVSSARSHCALFSYTKICFATCLQSFERSGFVVCTRSVALALFLFHIVLFTLLPKSMVIILQWNTQFTVWKLRINRWSISVRIHYTKK